MPVSIVLGVGGEPCYPELLYFIQLESIAAIVSGNQSIVDFLCSSSSFETPHFVLQRDKPKEKAYTMEEKRKLYPNAYKPWSNDDDENLLILIKEKSIKELSLIFKRNERSIRSRINKLMA